MDKLRGTGSTFSTSGQDWKARPRWVLSYKTINNLKRRRKIAGAMPQTKAEARAAIEQAYSSHPITKVPECPRTKL